MILEREAESGQKKIYRQHQPSGGHPKKEVADVQKPGLVMYAKYPTLKWLKARQHQLRHPP
jgi:hypothetical protein